MGDDGMNSSVSVERTEGPSKGRYVIRLDGAEAELTYSKAGENTIIIDHTGVPDVFRGRGFGLTLLARAIADARKEGKKVIPLCPFAKATMAKHPEWGDVLK